MPVALDVAEEIDYQGLARSERHEGTQPYLEERKDLNVHAESPGPRAHTLAMPQHATHRSEDC